MAVRISKDIRNTVAAYLLFIYGCLFLPVMLISFESAAYEVNLISVLVIAGLISLITSMLFYNLKITVRFPLRIFSYWMVLTALMVFLWLVICDGTFIVRN